MTAAGAKALRKHLEDTSANPPVYARIATNGPSHEHVVHVTFGEPKVVTKTDKNNNVQTTKPKRPKPYTVS
jgi:hypothetical protein